ncbi:hypothetical protein LJ707_09105 [Mucilaginibacter sp. UR6-1]|uniref:5'-methylthioadenosine/S-adenosylhomocysteine nucleosidase family protein n=1 Tax=Mucilaginibacter sp. UR6-1 TaxID=1435643 RepID=UPI001E292B47|nr:hypothetical protein [Mucilaginibacter sp. UR6-1]MCC8409087.1 hypothetical protein [Mucilaginibacter sp. UR6-1]
MKEESNILTFLISDPKDGSFTEDIYTFRNFIGEMKPIVLHEFNNFYTIYNVAGNDFVFRVLIHAGLMDSGGLATGEAIISEFESKEEFKSLELHILTRNVDLFAAGQFVVKKEGRSYYNCKYLNRDDSLESLSNSLPVYRKGNLTITDESSGQEAEVVQKNEPVATEPEVTNVEHNNFAIITALYDDESTAFIQNSKKDRAFTSPMSNVMQLSFKDHDSEGLTTDYLQPYLLNHAQKMGMVDTTFNSVMMLEKYNPKYLIMAGVCGGKQGKVDESGKPIGLKYRDVIIANNIMDIQMGKLEKGVFKPYLFNESMNDQLLSFLEQERLNIKRRMYLLADQNDEEFLKHVQNVEIRIGDYGCGSQVINTDDYFKDEISTRNNKAIAVEMESYGIYRSCRLHNNFSKKGQTLPIVVKGVMDYTDATKDDNYKKDAAKMSYLCVRAMMPLLLDFYDKNIPI